MCSSDLGRRESWSNSPYIQAAAATDNFDRRASFSSYGSFVDFAAPGQDVASLTTQNSYAYWDGTSFASPIAAGVAGLALEANPNLSPSQILRILRLTAIDLGKRGYDSSYGYGRLDALAAVQLALHTAGTWKPGSLLSGKLSGAAMTGLISNSSGLEEIEKLAKKHHKHNDGTPAVPEPASAAMMAVGVMLMMGRRKNF